MPTTVCRDGIHILCLWNLCFVFQFDMNTFGWATRGILICGTRHFSLGTLFYVEPLQNSGQGHFVFQDGKWHPQADRWFSSKRHPGQSVGCVLIILVKSAPSKSQIMQQFICRTILLLFWKDLPETRRALRGQSETRGRSFLPQREKERNGLSVFTCNFGDCQVSFASKADGCEICHTNKKQCHKTLSVRCLTTLPTPGSNWYIKPVLYTLCQR